MTMAKKGWTPPKLSPRAGCGQRQNGRLPVPHLILGDIPGHHSGTCSPDWPLLRFESALLPASTGLAQVRRLPTKAYANVEGEHSGLMEVQPSAWFTGRLIPAETNSGQPLPPAGVTEDATPPGNCWDQPANREQKVYQHCAGGNDR